MILTIEAHMINLAGAVEEIRGLIFARRRRIKNGFFLKNWEEENDKENSNADINFVGTYEKKKWVNHKKGVVFSLTTIVWGVCPNYEVLMFQPQTVTPPYLGSVVICYVIYSS